MTDTGPSEQETDPRPGLGPVVCGILLAADLESVVDAYEAYLALTADDHFSLDDRTARGLGLQQLTGNRACSLTGGSGRAWLTVIEAPQATPRHALGTHGWMAMEVLVENVDTLVERLADSPFEVLRPPADLDVSDRIRACQVRGPAGEILYLTQVTGAVPPFELPTCNAVVDHLFIPVMSTPDRDASLREYEALAGREGLRFDTRITVVNQALGLPLEQRHPVGTLQLAGEALIEIDEIAGTKTAITDLCSGTAAVVFAAAGKPPSTAVAVKTGPFAGSFLHPRTGRAGERTCLLYKGQD